MLFKGKQRLKLEIKKKTNRLNILLGIYTSEEIEEKALTVSRIRSVGFIKRCKCMCALCVRVVSDSL